MTSSVIGRVAGDRVRSIFASEASNKEAKQKTAAEAGARIAETLGELKGAVMKVGQMASIGAELLPPEMTKALASLQREAPPVDFSVISDQIERELGSPPELLFDRFERAPFASASIGQVHRARTDDGREVVVKVQYPGVDRSVDSDLAHLKVALRAAGFIRLKRKALNELFAEVRARLHEELDYTNEADNVRLFRDFHSGRGDDGIVIPEVVGERSSQRVLTLVYEPGDHLGELDEHDYSQSARDQAGTALVRLLTSQLFELGAIHADPNPANFAFRRDGTLVVYDFGCVKKLDPWILDVYRDLTHAFLDEDYELLDKLLIKIGARDPSGPPVPPDAYAQGREIFLPAFEEGHPFDFGESSIRKELIKLAPSFRKYAPSFQPPVPIIFVNRTVGGHAGNLRRLGARVDLMTELRPYL